MSDTFDHIVSASNNTLCEVMMRSFQERPYETQEAFLADLLKILGESSLYSLHQVMLTKYGLPHLGTSRVTYVSKSTVFKVPISPDGFRYNDAEASLVSTDFVDAENLANTKLRFFQDIPVLVMENIDPADIQEIKSYFGKIPDWVYAIDMAQVGFSKNGTLKAYDYADLLRI